ncbi:MAG: DNA/RNA non-specific endonuclease [Janthinobacterium lividum]
MSNMRPQAPQNNQQTWANPEDYCRTLVRAGNELYTICGSYGCGGTGSLGYQTTIASGKVTRCLLTAGRWW